MTSKQALELNAPVHKGERGSTASMPTVSERPSRTGKATTPSEESRFSRLPPSSMWNRLRDCQNNTASSRPNCPTVCSSSRSQSFLQCDRRSLPPRWRPRVLCAVVSSNYTRRKPSRTLRHRPAPSPRAHALDRPHSTAGPRLRQTLRLTGDTSAS